MFEVIRIPDSKSIIVLINGVTCLFVVNEFDPRLLSQCDLMILSRAVDFDVLDHLEAVTLSKVTIIGHSTLLTLGSRLMTSRINPNFSIHPLSYFERFGFTKNGYTLEFLSTPSGDELGGSHWRIGIPGLAPIQVHDDTIDGGILVLRKPLNLQRAESSAQAGQPQFARSVDLRYLCKFSACLLLDSHPEEDSSLDPIEEEGDNPEDQLRKKVRHSDQPQTGLANASITQTQLSNLSARVHKPTLANAACVASVLRATVHSSFNEQKPVLVLGAEQRTPDYSLLLSALEPLAEGCKELPLQKQGPILFLGRHFETIAAAVREGAVEVLNSQRTARAMEAPLPVAPFWWESLSAAKRLAFTGDVVYSMDPSSGSIAVSCDGPAWCTGLLEGRRPSVLVGDWERQLKNTFLRMAMTGVRSFAMVVNASQNSTGASLSNVDRLLGVANELLKTQGLKGVTMDVVDCAALSLYATPSHCVADLIKIKAHALSQTANRPGQTTTPKVSLQKGRSLVLCLSGTTDQFKVSASRTIHMDDALSAVVYPALDADAACDLSSCASVGRTSISCVSVVSSVPTNLQLAAAQTSPKPHLSALNTPVRRALPTLEVKIPHWAPHTGLLSKSLSPSAQDVTVVERSLTVDTSNLKDSIEALVLARSAPFGVPQPVHIREVDASRLTVRRPELAPLSASDARMSPSSNLLGSSSFYPASSSPGLASGAMTPTRGTTAFNDDGMDVVEDDSAPPSASVPMTGGSGSVRLVGAEGGGAYLAEVQSYELRWMTKMYKDAR